MRQTVWEVVGPLPVFTFLHFSWLGGWRGGEDADWGGSRSERRRERGNKKLGEEDRQTEKAYLWEGVERVKLCNIEKKRMIQNNKTECKLRTERWEVRAERTTGRSRYGQKVMQKEESARFMTHSNTEEKGEDSKRKMLRTRATVLSDFIMYVTRVLFNRSLFNKLFPALEVWWRKIVNCSHTPLCTFTRV